MNQEQMSERIPPRIAKLPRDEKGRPVPFFVQWIDGKPDFRIVEIAKLVLCHRERLCWVCGERLGQYKSFIIGPMCSINRVSAEPPSHFECATFSVKVCPFLSTPKMHRRERDLPLPEQLDVSGGIALKRNPGVALVWVTKSYQVEKDGMGGVVFRLGAPEHVHWYCEGRVATRAEIEESIRTGLPILEKIALEDGPRAFYELGKQVAEAMQFLPA